MSRLLLLMAAGTFVLGAQTPLGGPSLGFVYDSQGQALRPILGIPGASIFGDPLETDAPLGAGAVSLRQNLAIVNDGAWKMIALTPDATDPVALPDGLPASGRVVVSETGAAAAFYDKENHALSVVKGIGSASMTTGTISLDGLPGDITALAAADDGSLLVSASIPDGGEALLWIAQDGSTRQLATLQGAASLLLWNGGASAVVVDRAANQVWKVQDPGGNAALTLLAADTDGVADPLGAAMSADGKQLWVANSNRTLLGVDTLARTTVSLNCTFDLTTVLPLTDGLTFRLNDLTSGPMWLLDTTPGSDPRVVFVPAIPAQTATEESAQ